MSSYTDRYTFDWQENSGYGKGAENEGPEHNPQARDHAGASGNSPINRGKHEERPNNKDM